MAFSATTSARTLVELQRSLPGHKLSFVGTYKEDKQFNATVTGALKEVWYDATDDKLYAVVTRNV